MHVDFNSGGIGNDEKASGGGSRSLRIGEIGCGELGPRLDSCPALAHKLRR